MPLADAKPDPKPLTEGGIGRRKPDRANRRKGRKMATEYEWVLLRAEKLGPCRVCENWGTISGFPIGLHHVVPRSLGGDDVADNLIPLCSADHRLVTDHRPDRLRIVAESLTDAEYAYVVGKLGEGGPARLFGVGR